VSEDSYVTGSNQKKQSVHDVHHCFLQTNHIVSYSCFVVAVGGRAHVQRPPALLLDRDRHVRLIALARARYNCHHNTSAQAMQTRTLLYSRTLVQMDVDGLEDVEGLELLIGLLQLAHQ